MMIPGFYEFRTQGRGNPDVSMLVGAIPVVKNGERTFVAPADMKELDLDQLVLVYHLFQRQRDPFCIVMPNRGRTAAE